MSEQKNGQPWIEPPLDRLNYYNGQRLEARDLRLEQAYHMRVRRWFNRSLFPEGGVVEGLHVKPVKGESAVIVTAGLALDTKGREIILLKDCELDVPCQPETGASQLAGSYLTIRYEDRTASYESDRCIPRSAALEGEWI